jgi:quercetin dioxygenase-like cupin family protein
MQGIDLGRVIVEAPALVIRTGATTESEAAAAMQMLADFNACTAGVVRFSGETPWERHPDDEFLHVLEGEVQLTLLGERGQDLVRLRAGQVFVVPRGSWHRQHAETPAALLFITSREGNEASEAADPRVGRAP